MELCEAIQKRRSIRKYTDEPVSEADLDAILRAGLVTPSSKGLWPIEFVVVRDKENVIKTAQGRQGSSVTAAAADTVIVVIGDSEKADAWIEDGALAMGQMMLRATELGLGCVWIHCRNRFSEIVEDGERLSSEAYLKRHLGIPEKYSVLCMMALGHPAQELPGRSLDDADMAKIHRERF